MSDDWKVGDLALCIDDSPCPVYGPAPYRKGVIYTVTDVALSSRGNIGLKLAGVVIGSFTGAAYHGDFRKIRPDEHEGCEPEFVTLLNRMKQPADLVGEGLR